MKPVIWWKCIFCKNLESNTIIEMSLKILSFGSLTDITGSSFEMPLVFDTDSLIESLKNKYPALADKKILLAVNAATVQQNTSLKENDTVAILPPFSGG